MSSMTSERRIRLIDRTMPMLGHSSLSELHKWLRTLPHDVTVGDLDSVLVEGLGVKAEWKRKPSSKSTYSDSSMYNREPRSKASADKGKHAQPFNSPYYHVNSTDVNGRGNSPYQNANSPLDELDIAMHASSIANASAPWGTDDDPRDNNGITLDDGTVFLPEVPETPVVSDRIALMFVKLNIEKNNPESFGIALTLIKSLCYEHEVATVLTEALIRYPREASTYVFDLSEPDRILISSNDEMDLSSVVEDTLPASGSALSGSPKGASDNLPSLRRIHKGKPFKLVPFSLRLNSAEHAMVGEAIGKIPGRVAHWEKEILEPSSTLHSRGLYQPRDGHRSFKDLEFEHDRNHVNYLWSLKKHQRMRVFQEILERPTIGRPYEVTARGDFHFLLYKGVEIVSIHHRDLPRPKSAGRLKTLSANKQKKKIWIEYHRSICVNGCRHCQRFT